MKFSDLKLSDVILRAVEHEGYETPTPIQAQAIPHIVEGKDVLGCAQTGTGKTAAFSLPILHRLHASQASVPHPNQHKHRPIRALILSPTRELALQIDESIRTYGGHTHLRSACIFGGVSQGAQTRALKNGVDIVVATPGRLMDLMEQGYVDLSHVEVFVLDEADRMLDMGFIQPIRMISSKVPKKRQTLLFSATMPKEIRHLADSLLTNPVSVQVAAVAATPDLVEQSVYFVSKREKPALLIGFLQSTRIERALVFTRTKHGADRVTKDLNRAGIRADAIHGNKRQNVRQRTLADFKSGKTWVLVATDIAARGIDVDGITHVVNYELPNEPETYVHRIGRTARAGTSGEAIAFCDRSSEERDYLKWIEKLIRKPIRVRDDDPSVEMARPDPSERPERSFEDRPERGHHGGRGGRGGDRGGFGGGGRGERSGFGGPPRGGHSHPRDARPPAQPRRDDRGQDQPEVHVRPQRPQHAHSSSHPSSRPASHGQQGEPRRQHPNTQGSTQHGGGQSQPKRSAKPGGHRGAGGGHHGHPKARAQDGHGGHGGHGGGPRNFRGQKRGPR